MSDLLVVPGEIWVKDTYVLSGLMNHKFHSKLLPILSYMANKYGIVITESYRTGDPSKDLHSTNPVRAVDLRYRCYDKDKTKAAEISKKIEADVNSKWKYDPNSSKVCAWLHSSSKNNTGLHFHIQVSTNTVSI
jgi:hypothetical protein